MVDSLAELTIVVKQPPAPLELDDGVVGRPAQDGLEDAPRVREGAQRALGRGVDNVVRVAGRVAKVVRVAPLVHPGRLEEAPVVVVGRDRLARLGRQDDQVPHLVADEAAHVRRQARRLGEQGPLAAARGLLGPQPRGVELVVPALVALQLPAPEPAKVQVSLAVVGVDKGRRVDAEAAPDGFRVRDKGALGPVADGDADAEDALAVPGGEVEVVPPVPALSGVGGPELLADPGHVLGAQHHAVVHHVRVGRVQARRRVDVVVGHVVLVPVVVEGYVRLPVVRGVNVHAPVEDVGGRVRRVQVGYQWWCHFILISYSICFRLSRCFL